MTTPTRLPSRFDILRSRARLLTGLALLAGVLLALGALLRLTSDELLRRDAEHAALAWAQFVAATVQDLEPLLEGGGLTPEARADLRRLVHVQDIFRFRLFDARGREVVGSDDLEGGRAADATALGHGNRKVHDLVLGGQNQVELERGDGHDRPAVYSEAYVPVVSGSRVLGVVEVYVDQVAREQRIHGAFLRVAGAALLLFAAVGGWFGWQALRRMQRERLADERLRYLAEHDVLSGLLNRSSFHEALRQAVWRGSAGGPGFAVLCIDLDGFKDVNETLGHAAGDDVLRQVGQRLRGLIRHGDQVARLGGDEFALLQTGVSGPEAVTRLAERVVRTLGEPYAVAGGLARCGASLGAAMHGVDGRTEEELMHKADLALQRAKTSGRNTFGFYDAALDDRLEQRRALTRELRSALEGEQLALHFQPLYAGDAQQLLGYEALVRWMHPTRGPIPPAEFIPLAEDTGLIDPLGRWVLSAACAAAATWPPHLSVAVNLSAAQFKSGDLVELVARTLEQTGLAATRLELEITESLLMSSTEQVLATLHALAATGVRIAMDDFGTGYSSLAYLWRFPFHKLKIDRAFTQHLGQDGKVGVIVKSIISLAHALQIRVNAEGVETPEQLAALRAHGCDELQGYLLGRPRPLLATRLTGAGEVLPPRPATATWTGKEAVPLVAE